MKKRILLGIISAAILAVSCNDDYLNIAPKDERASSDITWADGALSQAFVFGIYASLGNAGFEEEGLSVLTDEAMFTHSNRGINIFNEGTSAPGSLGNTRIIPTWNELYSAIRDTNIAIENLPEATFDDAVLKETLLGESYFLRAYYYQQLLRYFGGVPLVDRTYDLNEDYDLARSSFEETVGFIVNDLDQAASMLDGKTRVAGRASRIAAMALKARVLLYAASDLHDAATAGNNSSVLGSFSDINLVAISTGSQAERWTTAKDAAKAVLDEAAGTYGYKFGLTSPVTAEEGRENYISLALGGGSAVGDTDAASDLIWERTHSELYVEENEWPLGGINVGVNNGPNGYHNWAGNTPIQQLVDDYEMMDGSKFDWNNATHAADPFADRDPRFYGTVLYDGADWKPRPDDVLSFDTADQVQTGSYDDGSGGTIAGVDTRQSPVEDWNGSRTGYYVRKFIDPDAALVDNRSNAQLVPWPFIRYTEVVLNYVEACIETGDEAEALDWLNQIRYRVGMPAIADTGDALRDRYRNERRVELAYEEHRFFDARRWMIAQETLGRGIKVMQAAATLKPGATPHVPYRHDKAVYDYTYTVVNNTDIETRTWDDKMYYRAIESDEISKNSLLVQNPGY